MKKNILKTTGFTLLILFLYFLTSVFMTYPLILHFSSVMPGNGGDEYLMTWFFWEFYHSVFILHQFPYFTRMVYYPHGIPLYVTTAMPVNAVIASIMYFFTKNLILAYNILFLSASILNGYFAFLLADDTLHNKKAAFFAGLIFAFSPILIEQARWGDLNIWSCYGVPLYIMFFNRLYKDPNLKNALLASLGLFLATYAGFYEFTAMLFLYSVFFIIYKYAENYKKADATGTESFRNKLSLKIKGFINNPVFNRRYVKYLSIMILSFAAVSSPLLLPAFYYVYFKPHLLNFNPNMFWTKAYSATFINLFIPPFYNHLLLDFTKKVYFNGFYPIMYRGANSVDFLGYIPLIFFIIAAIKGFRNVKYYFIAFAVFLLMSLSPLIHIINNIRVFDPFVYLLDITPVIKDVQESGRYMIIGYLFFGIICAYGIKAFFDLLDIKMKRHSTLKPYLNGILILLIFAGTLAGYSAYPFEMKAGKVPEGIYILKNQPYGAVMTVPFMQGGFKMYEQTIYNKPMLGGYIIRYGFHDLYKKYLPERFYNLKDIHYNGNGINQIVINRLGNPAEFRRNFKYLKIIGVRYIIILKNLLPVEYGWSKKRAKEVLSGLKRDNSILNIIYNGKNTMIIKLYY